MKNDPEYNKSGFVYAESCDGAGRLQTDPELSMLSGSESKEIVFERPDMMHSNAEISAGIENPENGQAAR